MPKTKPFHAVAATANDLRTGAVVYREPDGRWGSDARRAEIAESQEAADQLLRRAKADHDACLVVEPVLIEMTAGRPVALRERIRDTGPTAGIGRTA
jgi:hypothetical protein